MSGKRHETDLTPEKLAWWQASLPYAEGISSDIRNPFLAALNDLEKLRIRVGLDAPGHVAKLREQLQKRYDHQPDEGMP